MYYEKDFCLDSFDYKGQDNLEANDGERQSSADTVVGSVDSLVVTFLCVASLGFHVYCSSLPSRQGPNDL